MTLDLYIARRFFGSFLRVFGVFLGVLLLIDLIEQIRRFSDDAAGISLAEAFVLALLNVPESLYQILPLLMILAAIALFLALAKSSELVVVRATGRSGLRFLVSPVLAALAIGAFAVTVLNPLVAATSQEYQTRIAARSSGTSILSVSAEGLWMRQGDGSGQMVIRADHVSPEGTELAEVSFHLFSPSGGLIGRIEAQKARLQPGAWQLDGAKRWDFAHANPEAMATLATTPATLSTDLTPARLIEGLGRPTAVGFWDMTSQAEALERAGFSARSYRLGHQMELALPLLLAAMVLVAAGFSMRHARFGKTGQMVLYALMAGFFIFFLRNFSQVLGENGQIPIIAAAWIPPVTASLLALSLLLHLEDG